MRESDGRESDGRESDGPTGSTCPSIGARLIRLSDESVLTSVDKFDLRPM